MKRSTNKKRIAGISAAAMAACAVAGFEAAARDQASVPLVPERVNKDMQDKIWAAVPDKATVAPKKPRRVLVYSKSGHEGVWCGFYAFQAMGVKSGAYEPVPSDDPAMLLPESLSKFDAVVFNNTGIPSDLPVMKSVLDYVEQGGGIAGTHTAMLNYGPGMAYRWLWGAGYAAHPWHHEIGIKPVEPDHPLLAAFKGQPTRLREETYQFCDPYSRGYMRTLIAIEVETTDMSVREKPGWIIRADDDFALAWIRKVGLGRLFYCALGHDNDVFFRPEFMQFYLDSMQFILGDYEVPSTPSYWGEVKEGEFDIDAVWSRIEKSLPEEQTVIRNQCPSKFLDNDLMRERIVFLRTIPYYAGKAATPMFLEALQDNNQHVRMAALQGLGGLGDPEVLPVLAEAACSVDPVEKNAARGSMARMRGDDIEPAMLAMAKDDGELPEIRCEVIAALAMRGSAGVAPALLDTARDSEKDVRTASLAALAEVADAASAPALIALIKDAQNDDERMAAADALAAAALRSGAPAAESEKMAAVYADAAPDMRRGLLRAMGKVGGAKALETAKAALKDKDQAVSMAALQALALWPDASPIDDLLALANEGDNAERKAAALAGYIRMIGLKRDAGLPAADACSMYESAMDMADRNEEKKAVLDGLAKTPDLKALTFLEQYLEEIKTFGDDSLMPQAETAYVEAAILLGKTHAKEAREALEMFAGASKNKELAERAAKAAQEIK